MRTSKNDNTHQNKQSLIAVNNESIVPPNNRMLFQSGTTLHRPQRTTRCPKSVSCH